MPEFKFIDPATGRIMYGTALADAKGRIVPAPTSEGQAHNRNLAAANITYAAATNSAQWPAGPVTDFEIAVPGPAGLTGVLVVYGAPNDATASAWLADPGSISSDVSYDLIPPNTIKSRQLSAGITRIDILPLGANTRIVIGAV